MINNKKLDELELFKAISKAQSNYIANKDTRQIFDDLLVSLLSLTGSEFGYIGEVSVTPDGVSCLRTHAISNIAWNDETRRFYEENAAKGLEFDGLNTLFGYVIDKQEVVISNDPVNDERAGGLPDGHPRLDAFLGLPFMANGEIVGSAGISNRSGGYNEEVVNFLKPFMEVCANIFSAEKARKEKF